MTQIVSNIERTKCVIPVRIYIIATIPEVLFVRAFSKNVASPSKWLNSNGCYSATCHLKCQKSIVSCNLKANVTVNVKISFRKCPDLAEQLQVS